MQLIVLSLTTWFFASALTAVMVGSCIGYGNGAQSRRTAAREGRTH
jgi:hypothetical protein